MAGVTRGRLVDANEVVVHEVQRYGCLVVGGLFTKCIC
jgi:hypothetical protein